MIFVDISWRFANYAVSFLGDSLKTDVIIFFWLLEIPKRYLRNRIQLGPLESNIFLAESNIWKPVMEKNQKNHWTPTDRNISLEGTPQETKRQESTYHDNDRLPQKNLFYNSFYF